MLCERCNKKKATVHYREHPAGGPVRVRRLCAECTEILEAAGELEDMSDALASYASPFFRAEEGCAPLPAPMDEAAGRRACPLCGLTVGEIAATGKVGCARCYAAFEAELAGTLCAMHGRVTHTGRVSASARERRERMEQLARLKRQLKDAVSAEEFERAAALRDEIRSIERAFRAS